MPELFGNAYILPAVIVVVLLLIVAVLLMARKRKAGSISSHETMEHVLEKPATPAPKRLIEAKPTATVAPAQPAAELQTPSASAASHPDAEASPLAVAHSARKATAAPAATAAASGSVVTGLTGLRLNAAPPNDPLHAVIVDLLQGWGELTPDDLKRLALFRPEKVLERAEKMELPKDHKGNEQARARLLQIRKYASDAQFETKPTVAESVKTLSPVISTEASRTAEAADKTQPAEAAETAGLDETADTTDADKIVSDLTSASTTTKVAAGVAATDFFGTVPISLASEDRSTLEKEETLDEARREGLIAEVTAGPPFTEPVVPSFWTEDSPGWEIDETPVHQEIWNSASPWRVEEKVPTIAEAEISSGEIDLTARAQTPRDFLLGLPGQIKTAEDLMALPPEERGEMLVFLEPSQLSEVFASAEDPDLKKAVVDTLEHAGNPASLEVLRRCLDDPDPQIQLYALDAADRLLGVE